MLSLKLTELPGAQLSDFPCSRALRGQNAAHAPPPSRGRLRGVDASMSARAAAAASAMSCTLRACPWRPWRRVAAMGSQSQPPSRHSRGASPSDALEARAVRASSTPAQLRRWRMGVVRSELVQRGRGWCLRARQRLFRHGEVGNTQIPKTAPHAPTLNFLVQNSWRARRSGWCVTRWLTGLFIPELGSPTPYSCTGAFREAHVEKRPLGRHRVTTVWAKPRSRRRGVIAHS